ncbi:MAG: hypothetical protein WCQ89_15705, partial [Verrucomicrobiota bacterium]
MSYRLRFSADALPAFRFHRAVTAMVLLLVPLLASAQGPKRRPNASGGTPAGAAAAVEGEKTGAENAAKAERKEDKEPVLAVTEHSLKLGARIIKYRATAGYM